MYLNAILLGFIGFVGGISTAAGLFALLISLGVITRIIAKVKDARHVIRYETAMTLGGITGCIISVYLTLELRVGVWAIYLYGICAGIFVGCQAVALAEIINMFPIMFRRIKLKEGLSCIMISMALGKLLGSLLYFYYK